MIFECKHSLSIRMLCIIEKRTDFRKTVAAGVRRNGYASSEKLACQARRNGYAKHCEATESAIRRIGYAAEMGTFCVRQGPGLGFQMAPRRIGYGNETASTLVTQNWVRAR